MRIPREGRRPITNRRKEIKAARREAPHASVSDPLCTRCRSRAMRSSCSRSRDWCPCSAGLLFPVDAEAAVSGIRRGLVPTEFERGKVFARYMHPSTFVRSQRRSAAFEPRRPTVQQQELAPTFRYPSPYFRAARRLASTRLTERAPTASLMRLEFLGDYQLAAFKSCEDSHPPQSSRRRQGVNGASCRELLRRVDMMVSSSTASMRWCGCTRRCRRRRSAAPRCRASSGACATNRNTGRTPA